jgi:transposase
LVEQLDYNLLFRWFVGLSVDESVWDHSSFTKNRNRLIEAGVARKLLRRVGLAPGARGCSPRSTSASMAR